MPTVFCPEPSVALAALIATTVLTTGPAFAGTPFAGATEWTQIMNNAELVSLVGQSGEQIGHQITQISQLAEQIRNQIRIYQNMLQNTLTLPSHVWGQVESDLNRLRSLVNQGRGIAFSMGNADDVLHRRFKSFSEFKSGLENGETFSESYRQWSDTNRDTIASTLRAAGLTAEQFGSEESTMRQLRAMSQSAAGQMQALQAGHRIAAQQVAQAQKLRGLVSQQITMMGAWYQSEQAARDLAQNRREEFFNATAPSASGGQQMEPRW